MNKLPLRIGFISDFPLAKTGFGRAQRCLLIDLYKTGKYQIYTLNQGVSDNLPEFNKLPWTSFGVFKNFDQNRFNSDPNYQRMVGYGNFAVENFVVSNKLDVVVHVQDIWSSSIDYYLKQDWYKHVKNNFIQHTTCDSVPILPEFKEWAKNCPNMWFWSSFAERELKKEDIKLYGHCKTVHGAIESDKFYPLKDEERTILRNKFGISSDEKIILFLGRNQIRKLSLWANQEALAKFKQKHPNQKIRLLFHTGWFEQGGWPIDRIREELKLDRNDILTTYFCRNCNEWNIQPYYGDDLDCPICKAQKSRITCGTNSSVTEEDLNKIYNIADASCSIATSAGLELTNCESLLAGVPLATVAYSGMEEFTPNDFVYTIKGTFTREVGSGFKKFVPDINSIVEFYEYIFDLSYEKRQDIVKRGREWCIKEFDVKNISKIFQDFFDSCRPIDWDSFNNKKKELKNINPQIQDKPIDDDFVMECYSKILNMAPPPEDEGRKHWNGFLKQPKDKNQLKQEMVNSFIDAAKEHNSKVVQKVSFESFLDPNDKERCLLTLKESIGDHIILTSLLPEIQNKYPNASIYISADPKFHEIYDGNPYIKKCLNFAPEHTNEMLMGGVGGNKKYFDYIHIVGLATQFHLNYLNSEY